MRPESLNSVHRGSEIRYHPTVGATVGPSDQLWRARYCSVTGLTMSATRTSNEKAMNTMLTA